MKSAELKEAICSIDLHQKTLPLLVSSLYLRENGLGQIDVAGVYKLNSAEKILEIIEVKSSRRISPQQVLRLRRSCNHLAQVLKMSARFKVNFCQKDDPSLFF